MKVLPKAWALSNCATADPGQPLVVPREEAYCHALPEISIVALLYRERETPAVLTVGSSFA